MFIVNVWFLHEALSRAHAIRFHTRPEAEMYVKDRQKIFGNGIRALFDIREVARMDQAILSKFGNRWTHPSTGEVRYYMDPIKAMEIGGLELVFYNTGNISGAWLDGNKISNAEGRRMLNSIYKVYVTEGGKAVVQINQYGRQYPEFAKKIETGLQSIVDGTGVA